MKFNRTILLLLNIIYGAVALAAGPNPPPFPGTQSRTWSTHWNRAKSCSELLGMITEQDAISTRELKDLTYRNLDSALKVIPKVSGDVSPSNLETIPLGTYRLSGPPSPELLEYLPKFRKGNAEVGLHRIKGQWVITISREQRLELEQPLKSIEHTDAVEVDLHSHPGTSQEAKHPSFEDLDMLLSLHSRRIFIATHQGILELVNPPESPVESANQQWSTWVTRQGMNEEAFNREGSWNVLDRFCRERFKMRLIPWSDKSAVAAVLR